MPVNETVFLDTCVWIELLVVNTPTQQHQKTQANLAGNLLKNLQQSNAKIVTCEHQLLELINATLKAKKNEFNRRVKSDPVLKGKGVSSAKELRAKHPDEFKDGVAICRMAISSIKTLTTKIDSAVVSIDNILDNLECVDINDYIYYEYCKENSITLYTFDKELKAMDTDNVVVLL